MRAEIVTTGTELLLGQIDDTNATYLARQLRDLGLNLFFRSTVGDNDMRIAQALEQALGRADVVITTGGLGPTVDDVTREAVARVTGRPLVLYPDLLAQIESFFDRIGARMTENNRKQAYLPDGCVPMENPVGTAPAFAVKDPRGIIVTLPGVPREMRYLMEHTVIPFLRAELGLGGVIKARLLRTVGIGESRIDNLIADLETSANPTVGLSAHPGQTDVRVAAKAATEAEADGLIEEMAAQIRARLGDYIFAEGDAALEAVVVEALQVRGLILAVAEVGTAGAVAQRLSEAAGAEAVFRGGLAVPDLTTLACWLGTRSLEGAGERQEPIQAEPEVTVVAAAQELRETCGASAALTVLAGPDRIAGTWVALATPEMVVSRRLRVGGSDDRERLWTATLSLDFLRRALLGLLEGWAE
jgi:nicotinamide-nucleotide amidase